MSEEKLFGGKLQQLLSTKRCYLMNYCSLLICRTMLFRDVIVALYRGLESKLIQTVLTSALMLATYEHIVSVIFLLV